VAARLHDDALDVLAREEPVELVETGASRGDPQHRSLCLGLAIAAECDGVLP
jgi:hypothetical protein